MTAPKPVDRVDWFRRMPTCTTVYTRPEPATPQPSTEDTTS